MPTKRYLIINTDHPFDPEGINSGAENATVEHARALTKLGMSVTVGCILKGGERECEGIRYADLGQNYDIKHALDIVSREGDFHLISEGKTIAFFLAREYPECRSKILVSHDRSLNDTGVRAAVLERLVDKVICVSEAQKQILVRDGLNPDLMEVVRNGVNFERFKVLPGITKNPKSLVFVGALVPDKGIQLLIKSYQLLLQRYPDLELEVYGDATLWGREKFFDPAEVSKVLPGIKFHGKVKQDVLVEAYNKAAFCVVPSIWFDPFPLTSIEAQACGCPVVTFDIGGLPEGIVDGKTGVVVREIAEGPLANAIDVLLSDPELLKTMSASAKAHVAEKHTWERVARALVTIANGQDSDSFESQNVAALELI